MCKLPRIAVEVIVFFLDTFRSLKQPNLWVFTTWFKFLMQYRRTIIGPLWIIASPVAFILFLGALLSNLSPFGPSEFIPHLTVGFVTWTLMGGYVIRAPGIFSKHRAFLLQGKAKHTDIVLIDNAELIIHFLHQIVIIVVVCLWYKTLVSPYAFVSLIGLFFLIINGYWLSFVFGVLGIRFRDFGQLMTAIISIAFLATPIIWMPQRGNEAATGRGAVLERYMDFNPFYHFLELIRSPLLNIPIEPLSWYVVIGFTVVGYLTAAIFYKKYRRYITVWL